MTEKNLTTAELHAKYEPSDGEPIQTLLRASDDLSDSVERSIAPSTGLEWSLTRLNALQGASLPITPIRSPSAIGWRALLASWFPAPTPGFAMSWLTVVGLSVLGLSLIGNIYQLNRAIGDDDSLSNTRAASAVQLTQVEIWFKPTANIAAIAALLEGQGARIISGPTAGGSWVVSVSRSQAEAAIAAFSASELVNEARVKVSP